MMFRVLVLPLVVLLLSSGFSFGEDVILRIRNTGGQPEVEFLFRSVAERGEPMQRVRLVGPNEQQVTLRVGSGPFDVMVRYPPKGKTGTLHACIAEPVYLDKIAMTGVVVDLRSVPAQGANGAKQITQADMVVNGKTMGLLQNPERATPFAKKLLAGRWISTYVAIDGSTQQSTDSFESLVMEGAGFRGQMSDVLAVENREGLYLVGRWSALGDSGDFYLTIDRNRPDELKGHYTQEGDVSQRKYEWTARKAN